MKLNNRFSLAAATVGALLLATAPFAAERQPPVNGANLNNDETQLEKVKPREMIDVGIEHNEEEAGDTEPELVGPGRLPDRGEDEEPTNPRVQNVHDGAFDTPGTNTGAYTDTPEYSD